MPVSALHRQLATIALGAAARYGFALAGGNALIAHGVVSRFTADVDLFTDEEASVAGPPSQQKPALVSISSLRPNCCQRSWRNGARSRRS